MKGILSPAEIIDRYTERYRDFERATGKELSVEEATGHLRLLLTSHDMKFDAVLTRRLDQLMPTGAAPLP